MKLFTVGPVQMYNKTLEISSEQLPYFRTENFSELMFKIDEKIKKTIYTNEKSKSILITASGTGAMEAVISSAFDENDKVLIINGGSFGERFCEICQIHNIKYDEIKLKFKEKLEFKHFEKIDGRKYTALIVNIHETSTGQLYNIDIIKEFAIKYNLYLVVDAISSFLADKYYMDNYKIDCTIISSQKALALAPGISIITVSERFYENKIANKNKRTLYLDLNEYINNMGRGQTPFTPAVGTILQLNQRLDDILKIGVQNIVNETAEKAEYLRNLVKERLSNVEILDYNLSNTLTPLYFKDKKAKEVFEYLKENYDIFVTPSGGELSEVLLRVGHIGNLNKEDFANLVDKIVRWYEI